MMDIGDFGLVLVIAAGLLVVAGGMGAGLAFVFPRLFPLPPLPAEEKAPAEPVSPEVLAARKAAYRLGIYVLVGLAVLTAVEFGVALVFEGSAALLFVLILAKAGLIIQYYMHLNNVWSEEAH
jgi:hypothetical protein